MNKSELADRYLEDSLESIKQLIKDAFLKGYEAGAANKPSSVNINGMNFVDLGLPSGTLWASPKKKTIGYGMGYPKYSYSEIKDENIPTIHDVEELLKNCKTTTDSHDVVILVGPLGNVLKVYTKDFLTYNGQYANKNPFQGEETPEDANYFWIKSDVSGNTAKVLGIFNDGSICVREHFIGFKLPVFLVKRKEVL